MSSPRGAYSGYDQPRFRNTGYSSPHSYAYRKSYTPASPRVRAKADSPYQPYHSYVDSPRMYGSDPRLMSTPRKTRKKAPARKPNLPTYSKSPITDKVIETGLSAYNRSHYVVCSMQGWRSYMEDAHNAIFCLENTEADYFGVYDGHGGAEVSELLAKELPFLVAGRKEFRDGNISSAMEKAFMAMDARLIADEMEFGDEPGSTACVAIVTPRVIVVGNVGDSRCVICRGGKAIPMTVDHKVEDDDEKARIKSAGCYIEDGRVNGDLAMSRAFGDILYKKHARLPQHNQAVVATPDINVIANGRDVEFMVIACDGIWEMMTCEEVVEFVGDQLKKRKSLVEISSALVSKCLAKPRDNSGNGRDNMTAIIVDFLGVVATGNESEVWSDSDSDSATDVPDGAVAFRPKSQMETGATTDGPSATGSGSASASALTSASGATSASGLGVDVSGSGSGASTFYDA